MDLKILKTCLQFKSKNCRVEKMLRVNVEKIHRVNAGFELGPPMHQQVTNLHIN